MHRSHENTDVPLSATSALGKVFWEFLSDMILVQDEYLRFSCCSAMAARVGAVLAGLDIDFSFD